MSVLKTFYAKTKTSMYVSCLQWLSTILIEVAKQRGRLLSSLFELWCTKLLFMYIQTSRGRRRPTLIDLRKSFVRIDGVHNERTTFPQNVCVFAFLYNTRNEIGAKDFARKWFRRKTSERERKKANQVLTAYNKQHTYTNTVNSSPTSISLRSLRGSSESHAVRWTYVEAVTGLLSTHYISLLVTNFRFEHWEREESRFRVLASEASCLLKSQP